MGTALGSEHGIPGEVQAAWCQHMGRFKAGRLDSPVRKPWNRRAKASDAWRSV